MTENEARKKWCPMGRTLVEGTTNSALVALTSMNMDRRNGVQYTPCLASECMMWRWHPAEVDPPTHGYCGLAGKP